jgi:hypothetical protein
MPECLASLMWGQAFGPAAGLPPGARKWKVFRQRREPGFYRVPFDVVLNPLAFFVAADQVVVAFILPERYSVQAKHPDGFMTGKAFERSKPLARRHVRRYEQMHVIRHDYERMQFVALESSFPVVERVNNHFGYFWLAKKHRAGFGAVKQSIHRDERLSGCQAGIWKDTTDRKASVQTECYEHSFAANIPMRETPVVPAHVAFSSGRVGIVSEKFVTGCAGRKPGGRPEGLPHYERL